MIDLHILYSRWIKIMVVLMSVESGGHYTFTVFSLLTPSTFLDLNCPQYCLVHHQAPTQRKTGCRGCVSMATVKPRLVKFTGLLADMFYETYYSDTLGTQRLLKTDHNHTDIINPHTLIRKWLTQSKYQAWIIKCVVVQNAKWQTLNQQVH